MSTKTFAHSLPSGRVQFVTTHPSGDDDPQAAGGMLVFRVVDPPPYWNGLKIDTESGLVIDDIPPSPGDDDLRTWAWSAETKRWVASKTTKAIAKEARADRDARLDASDRLVMPYVGDGDPVPAALKSYRKALRDVPGQPGFPQAIDWPVPPA